MKRSLFTELKRRNVLRAGALLLDGNSSAGSNLRHTNAEPAPAEAGVGVQLLLFAVVAKNWIPDRRCAASGMRKRGSECNFE